MNYLMNINASRLLTGFFLILAPALTMMTSYYYVGSKILFLVYGILTTLMLVSLAQKRNGYFSLFFLSFLILGCWVKTIFHFLFKIPFFETVGQFDYSAKGWDEVLLVLIVAFTTLLVCYWISAFLPKKVKSSNPPLKNTRYLLPLLLLSFISAIVLLYFNYYYSILKIGTEPLIKLPSTLYICIAFMVAWGNALLIASLTFWLIKEQKLKPAWMFYLLSTLGALTSISMSSRVQMILYTAVPFIVYFFKPTLFNKKFNTNEWIKILMVTGLLFITTLLFVLTDRYAHYSHAQLKDPSNTSSYAVSNKVIPSYIGKPKCIGNVKPAFWKRTLSQFDKLIINRWVGIEGVLAVSSASNELGTQLLRNALFESPSQGNDAIYQKISRSTYKKYKNFVFLMIPGPIAFLYFSGSLLIVSFGIACIYFVGYFIENLANTFIGNEAINGVIGVALAYLFVQLNFPITIFYFLVELIIFLGGITLLQALLKKEYPFREHA